MKPFDHFILTRFNVPLERDSSSGAEKVRKGLDAGWLARRFDLFERVCLPSVDRQTEGGFQWLVFLDWATPVAFKERMAALAVHNEFLHPVYCAPFTDEIALAEVRRREGAGGVRITTSLDSDDALHPRMIENVQELARFHLGAQDLKRGFFVSFPIGCSERTGDFYVRHDLFNSFISLVSSPECAQTVLAVEPAMIAEVAPVRSKRLRPMWCQAVHEDNATAPLRGIYWPWGGSSEFAPGVLNGFCRSPLWQFAEVVRSAASYVSSR